MGYTGKSAVRGQIGWVLAVVAAVGCWCESRHSIAQRSPELGTTRSVGSKISKERQLKLLQLQEAELARDIAKTAYERQKNEHEAMKRMWEDGIVSGKLYDDALRAFERAETEYESAKIQLARTKLNFLQDATHISILKAVKYRDEENRLWMEFTIKNSSNVEQAMVTEEDLERRDEIESLLRLEDIVIYITKASVNIGDPLELKVPPLGCNETFTSKFLLRDPEVEDVTLVIEYLDTVRNERVYLEKQSGEDIVRVTCLQFAQEGTLDSEVNYGIRLERLAEDEKNFALTAIGLPLNIRYRFEYQGRALSQVKFSERSQRYDIVLKCFVPEDIPDEELDIPIKFYAVVADAFDLQKVQNLVRDAGSNPVSSEQLAALKVGFEELRLIPKGFGELEIELANALLQVTQGNDAEALLEVKNTGTVDLLDVKVLTETPPGWEVIKKPPIIKKITLKDREAMRLYIDLPEDIGVGQYEMQVEAQSTYKGELITSLEKNIKIEVQARAELLLNTILVLLVVAAVIGVAFFTIKVARR